MTPTEKKKLVPQMSYLSPAQHEALRRLKALGVGDIAELVREGVDLLLAFREGARDLGPEALERRRQEVLEQLRGGR